jgi:hypothetical protein
LLVAAESVFLRGFSVVVGLGVGFFKLAFLTKTLTVVFLVFAGKAFLKTGFTDLDFLEAGLVALDDEAFFLGAGLGLTFLGVFFLTDFFDLIGFLEDFFDVTFDFAICLCS